MKTINLMKSFFVSVMLLGCSFMYATQYCETPITSGDHTIYLSCQKLNEGNYQILIEGESLIGIGGSYVNANGTGGYYLNGDHMVVAQDGTSITCNISSTTEPAFYTPLYVIISGVGEVNFTSPADIEWGTCDEVVVDMEAPVMGTATLVGEPTHNTAQIQVNGATDNIAVTAYHVVDAVNEYDQIVIPVENILNLKNLKSGTTYNFTVTAKDAYANESENSALVTLQTISIIYHGFATGHLGNPEFGDANGRILLTIQKENDASVSFIIEPNNEGTIIDFIRVELAGSTPVEIGTDQVGPSVAGQKITFTDLTSLDNLSVNVVWHTTSMGAGGRWTTNPFIVNESELYVEETGPSTSLPTAELNCSVYPNPVMDILNVESELQMVKTVLYNMMGQEVIAVAPNTNSLQVDCTALSQGSYMLNVIYENGQMSVFKVIK